MKALTVLAMVAILLVVLIQCSPPAPTATPLPPPTRAPTRRPTATEEPTASPTPCEHAYVTQSGDTLWGIANQFGTTVQAIRERNRLPDDKIWSGTELRIPCDGADDSTPPVPSPASPHTTPPPPSPMATSPRPAPTPTIAGCPDGCTYHKSGCDIKGNISIDTGEKIYHVPGGEYYNETIIKPEYGERWFCTEREAIANGWRRSKV